MDRDSRFTWSAEYAIGDWGVSCSRGALIVDVLGVGVPTEPALSCVSSLASAAWVVSSIKAKDPEQPNKASVFLFIIHT